MKQTVRTAVYDESLQIEAYRLQGTQRPFPNHFHGYYVIGLVESGTRRLSCRQQTYLLRPGSLLLLNPGDSHACTQCGPEMLDYKACNLSPERMEILAEDILGEKSRPRFSSVVIQDEDITSAFRLLHKMILEQTGTFEKEAYFLLLLTQLMRRYHHPLPPALSDCRREVETACTFMEENFAQRLSLSQICHQIGLSKSTLLRAFTKSKGVTPYHYLENIRVEAAKKLLEQGISPAEAALQTGFSDQSHFTNYFSRFIGLSPGA